MQVPPLSHLLRTAAGLGVYVQPDALPTSAAFLYQTIYDSLIPDLNLKHELRHSVALDTAVVLCVTHDSERQVPTNVECVGWHPDRVICRLRPARRAARAAYAEGTGYLHPRRRAGADPEGPHQPAAQRADPPRLPGRRRLCGYCPPPAGSNMAYTPTPKKR